MAVNRLHAFAQGLALPPPERLTHLPPDHPHQELARSVWKAFRSATEISDDAFLGVDAWPINLGKDPNKIKIGPSSVVRGIIRVEREGQVRIADHCYIGDDTVLSAHQGIKIGPDVLIAHGCQIFDNTTHPTDAAERAHHYRDILAGHTYNGAIHAAPIVIESGAWISMNSIIMRGVRIGLRSIVAAGSVVVTDVPADSTVAGNPARLVRSYL
jgi:acetyltransferase-like isoleucine patch superfamily enzyme